MCEWRAKVSGVRNAILPPQTTRPNPLVVGDRVFVSIFAPGKVCAVAREDGKALWVTELDAYGSSAVMYHNRRLYASSCRTLYAIDPETGEILWQFTPDSRPGEWLYSQPIASRDRIFIGDRNGHFHCISAKSGKPLWRRLTSRANNNQANGTGLVSGQFVLTANNNGTAVCYSAESGSTVWRQQLDGACVGQITRIGSMAIIPSTSLFGLEIKTGRVLLKLCFPRKSVRVSTVAKSRIVAVLGPDFRDKESSWTNELVLVEAGRVALRRELEGWTALRASSDTGLIYTTSLDHGVMNVIDLLTGSVLKSKRQYMSLPDHQDGCLYGLTDEGDLFADPSALPK